MAWFRCGGDSKDGIGIDGCINSTLFYTVKKVKNKTIKIKRANKGDGIYLGWTNGLQVAPINGWFKSSQEQEVTVNLSEHTPPENATHLEVYLYGNNIVESVEFS